MNPISISPAPSPSVSTMVALLGTTSAVTILMGDPLAWLVPPPHWKKQSSDPQSRKLSNPQLQVDDSGKFYLSNVTNIFSNFQCLMVSHLPAAASAKPDWEVKSKASEASVLKFSILLVWMSKPKWFFPWLSSDEVNFKWPWNLAQQLCTLYTQYIKRFI